MTFPSGVYLSRFLTSPATTRALYQFEKRRHRDGDVSRRLRQQWKVVTGTCVADGGPPPDRRNHKQKDRGSLMVFGQDLQLLMQIGIGIEA
ncbi:hypothetical protein L596_010096 [Steinernema carpocapsae]|uniref:Uncharacterized protein n=1 Tax=Steinernema carpocapsae TaxID=34508 RepID=A0A4U5PIM0_STECR|nr:hypothetical protein L596_010096 [Steinernema carpocapsae]